MVLPMAKSVIMRSESSVQRTDRLKAEKSHLILDPYSRHQLKKLRKRIA